jgi:hypothetical protein
LSGGVSRRGLFALAAGAMVVGASAKAESAACFDPEALPSGQKSLRQSLGFKLQSPDPAKSCGGCAFFTATKAGCGSCALLSGGPVTAASVCDSWAKKG